MSIRAIAICILFPLLAPAARAALPDEIQVYTDDINEPGEFALELHVNTTPSGRRTPDFPGEVTPYHGLRVTPELSWGLTRTLEAGFYLPFTRDAEGRVLFGGPKARLKWLPLKPEEGGTGWFAGLNAEYSWLNPNFEPETRRFELRPIIGWRNPDWLLAANPVLDWPRNGPEHGGRPQFNPSLKVARTVAQGLALGAEYYTELGRLGRPLPHGEQARTLYFAVDWESGPLPLQFGIGRGLNDATDKWTVKAIFTFTFDRR
jgi:hypothetical protein